MEELDEVISDYEYVVDRKSRGKLSPEYEARLKEVCTGTVFGYSSIVETTSEKTGIDIQMLDKIVVEFGNLDNFREYYIEFLINNRISDESKAGKFIDIYEKLAENCQIINVFDVSKPSLVGTPTMSYLIYLLTGDYARGKIVDREDIDKALNSLKLKESYVLFELANGKGKVSLETLAKRMNVTREMVRRHRNSGIYKMNSSSLRNLWIKYIDNDKRAQFIRKFFETRDIFMPKEVEIMSQNDREELLGILNISLEPCVQDNSFIQIPISDLELSTRAYRALIKGNYATLADVLNINSLSELVSIRQAGVKVIEEIMDKVHSLGYRFKFENEYDEDFVDDNETEESEEHENLKSAIRSLKATYKKYETSINACEALKEKLNNMVKDTEIQLSETKEDITILANKISSEDLEEI